MKKGTTYRDKELEGIFKASRWIARLMDGVVTNRETKELNKWIKASPRHEAWFVSLMEDQAMSKKLNVFREISTGTRSAFVETCIKAGINVAMRRQGNKRRSLVAALILLPLLAGLCWFLWHRPVARMKMKGANIGLVEGGQKQEPVNDP